MTGKELKVLVNQLPDDLDVFQKDPYESGGMIDMQYVPSIQKLALFKTESGDTFIDKASFYDKEELQLEQTKTFDAIVFEEPEIPF